MDLSVVVPVFNEEESLSELTLWIDKVCRDAGLDFEIIFIDDVFKTFNYSHFLLWILVPEEVQTVFNR